MTISPEGIDICHALPSQRKDNKRVHVCRFVSRKVKMSILSAKKNNRDFKFRGNTVFFNAHFVD